MQRYAFPNTFLDKVLSQSILIKTEINDRYKLIEKLTDENIDTFHDHKRIIEKLTCESPKKPITQIFLSEVSDMNVFHFSSTFDGVAQSENMNINDKFWRAAVKFGGIVFGPAGIPLKLEKVGPFIEQLPQTAGTFCITLKFTDIFLLRYVYKVRNYNEISRGYKAEVTTSDIEIDYLEFQWILFKKIVYNRGINRCENWKILHSDEKSSKNGFTIINIRNSNDATDMEYDRIIALNYL
jgi:hypothetical protein